jgi:hypothetical protein
VTAALRLTREGAGIELRRGQFEISVDGKSVGSIKYGETVETPLEPGRHILRLRVGRYSSRDRSFDATDGEIVSFRCHGAMMWPRYVTSLVIPDLAISLGQQSGGIQGETGGTRKLAVTLWLMKTWTRRERAGRRRGWWRPWPVDCAACLAVTRLFDRERLITGTRPSRGHDRGSTGEKTATPPIPSPQNRTNHPWKPCPGIIVGQKWRYSPRMTHDKRNSRPGAGAKPGEVPQSATALRVNGADDPQSRPARRRTPAPWAAAPHAPQPPRWHSTLV